MCRQMSYTPLPRSGRQVLPEHFADSLKHHFAAESGLRGLAGQGLVFRETAVVSQHDVGDGEIGRGGGEGRLGGEVRRGGEEGRWDGEVGRGASWPALTSACCRALQPLSALHPHSLTNGTPGRDKQLLPFQRQGPAKAG